MTEIIGETIYSMRVVPGANLDWHSIARAALMCCERVENAS